MIYEFPKEKAMKFGEQSYKIAIALQFLDFDESERPDEESIENAARGMVDDDEWRLSADLFIEDLIQRKGVNDEILKIFESERRFA